MNHHHTLRLLALTGLGSLIGLSAQAQSTSYYYAGFSFGQSEAFLNESRMNNSQMPPGVVTDRILLKPKDKGYKVFGGYQLTPNLAVEAGYFNLGRFRYTATTLPAGSVDARVSIQGGNLDLVGSLPLYGKVSALGRVGAQFSSTKDTFVAQGAATVPNSHPTQRETNYKFGLGLQYDISPAVLIRAEIERYRVSDALDHHGAVNLASLSLVFPFGRTSEAPQRVSSVVPYAPPELAPVTPMVMEAPAAGPVVEPVPVAAPPRKQVSFENESLFGFDQSAVMPQEKAALDTLSKELSGVQYDKVTVEGHADRIGTPEYNQQLSIERAEAVKAYLVQSGGLDSSKIEAVGKGETAPLTKTEACKGDKDSAQLRACLKSDRRVEVNVSGTSK